MVYWNACFILRWAPTGDSTALSNSTRGSLTLRPSPAAAPFKCQHLFSIKRVIVSERQERKRKSNCSATGHLWAHEKKLPTCLFVWLRAMAGENRNKVPIAHNKPQAVKPLMKRLWIYSTISQNCGEEFQLLFDELALWLTSKKNKQLQKKLWCPWRSLDIDSQRRKGYLPFYRHC